MSNNNNKRNLAKSVYDSAMKSDCDMTTEELNNIQELYYNNEYDQLLEYAQTIGAIGQKNQLNG